MSGVTASDTAAWPDDAAAWPTAHTRPVVLLGWPVRHSLSPQLHNAAFRELGLDLIYLAFPAPPGKLAAVVEVLGAVGAAGANVTVPHKQAVVRLCDHLTQEAELVGAVNTLVWGTDGLLGDNTDAAGLHAVLHDELGLSDGQRAVLLGTGGAARAAAVALGRLGAQVTVIGRRPDAAQALADLAATAGATETDAVDLAAEQWVGAAVRQATLVCNATPLGMAGERLPDAFHRLTPDQIAYDLVYQPPSTPFLHDARSAGAEAHHGLGMLVAQAAAAFRRWTGQPAPTAIMSAVAAAAAAAPEQRPSPSGADEAPPT